ncbi:uncharacterized protein [Amphiura filiformis]|uniref:uncharacterized protein n=1 Tax=Amphiura filiformis TaxID=82378 RepID=UPI003B21080E
MDDDITAESVDVLPGFNLTSNSLWDTVPDDITDDLIFQLDTIEAEEQARVPAAPAAETPAKLPTDSRPSPVRPKRFASTTEAELQRLEQARHEKKTVDSTAWAVRLFKDWCKESNLPQDFEKLPVAELATLLRKFYGEVRKTNGDPYSKSSLCNIRSGIQRHISSPPFQRTINIMHNEEFSNANNVFDGSLKKMKREGHDITKSHAAISEEDLDKLFAGDTLSTKNPVSLQRLVFFSLQFMFCRRGREGLRDLNKDSFKCEVDGSGIEYLTPTCNEHEKNHPATVNEQYNRKKKLYATNDAQCPVQAYKLYLSKLHPKCHALYQQPKKNANSHDPIWYNNCPLGHNTIGNTMKEISLDAKLSQIYTNHSIRATAIRVLNAAGVSDRIICSLSGHRNINSLRSYCSDASDSQKREMSVALHVSKFSRKQASHTISAPPDTPSNQQPNIAPSVRMPQPVPNRMPQPVPNRMPRPVPYRMPQQVPYRMPQQVPSNSSRMPVYQPPIAGQIVQRQSPTTLTTAQTTGTATATASANVLNMVAPQQQGFPTLFTGCSFEGATMNFYFNN